MTELNALERKAGDNMICEHCRDPIIGESPGRKYHAECAKIMKKIKDRARQKLKFDPIGTILNCKHCNHEFEKKVSRQVFCCKQCYRAYKEVNRENRAVNKEIFDDSETWPAPAPPSIPALSRFFMSLNLRDNNRCVN